MNIIFLIFLKNLQLKDDFFFVFQLKYSCKMCLNIKLQLLLNACKRKYDNKKQ